MTLHDKKLDKVCNTFWMSPLDTPKSNGVNHEEVY